MKKLLILFTLLFCAPLHAQRFDGLSDDIANGDYGNLKAVVIPRHGEIIYEDYFRGTFEISSAEVTTTVELTRITGDCS